MPHRQSEYLTKEKAALIQNELKNSSQQQQTKTTTNPNFNLKNHANMTPAPSSSTLINQNRGNNVPPQNHHPANTTSIQQQQQMHAQLMQQSNANRNPNQINRPIPQLVPANKAPNQSIHPSQHQLQQQQQHRAMLAAQLQANVPNHLQQKPTSNQLQKMLPSTSSPFGGGNSSGKQPTMSSISPVKGPSNAQDRPFFLNQPLQSKTQPHPHQANSGMIPNNSDLLNRQFNNPASARAPSASTTSQSYMNQQLQQQHASHHQQQLHNNRPAPYPPVNNNNNNIQSNHQAHSHLTQMINQGNHAQKSMSVANGRPVVSHQSLPGMHPSQQHHQGTLPNQTIHNR